MGRGESSVRPCVGFDVVPCESVRVRGLSCCMILWHIWVQVLWFAFSSFILFDGWAGTDML